MYIPAIVALSHPCNKFPIVAAMATRTDPHIVFCHNLCNPEFNSAE